MYLLDIYLEMRYYLNMMMLKRHEVKPNETTGRMDPLQGNKFESFYRDGHRWAGVFVTHRGGCLFCGVIVLRNLTTSESKEIDTTDSPYTQETSAYLSSLWEKHLGANSEIRAKFIAQFPVEENPEMWERIESEEHDCTVEDEASATADVQIAAQVAASASKR
jgi:hypothetical protein